MVLEQDKFVYLKYYSYLCHMGFNKKMYTCEVCSHTFIGEGNFTIVCDKKDCKKNKKTESISIQTPKKDIRVIGC